MQKIKLNYNHKVNRKCMFETYLVFFIVSKSLLLHTSFPNNTAFNVGEDTATWHATSFNAASDDIFGLLGLTPSFCLQPAAPQWQSWSAPNWTNLLNLLDCTNTTSFEGTNTSGFSISYSKGLIENIRFYYQYTRHATNIIFCIFWESSKYSYW